MATLTGTTTTMVIRTLDDPSRLKAGEFWRAVEKRIGDVGLFCSWDWTSAWLEQFGDVVEHEFVVAEVGGHPCGIALLTRSVERRGPLAIRRIHVGTAGEPHGDEIAVEYNQLCVGREHRGEFARLLIESVRTRRGWDELHLDGFAPAHAAALLAVDRRFTRDVRESRVLELDDDTPDLIDRLPSRSARASVRRSLKGLGSYTVEWASTVPEALTLFTELKSLHQRRWTSRGEPGAFSSSRFCAFHDDIIERWIPAGRAAVIGVRAADGVLVAALYGFVERGTFQYYQGGFRIHEDSKIRPGYAGHYLAACEARDRGLIGYEFLAGDARYKTQLSTSGKELVWAIVSRRTPRGLLIGLLRRSWPFVKRLRAWSTARFGAMRSD